MKRYKVLDNKSGQVVEIFGTPGKCPNCQVHFMQPQELNVEFKGELYDVWNCPDCAGLYLDWRVDE